jgi:altronate dehydratase small subunit
MIEPNRSGEGRKYIVLHPSDNTATALADLQKGETLHLDLGEESRAIKLKEPIPFAHKFAILAIPEGGAVRKYGQVIGEATRDIEVGNYVHIHNVVSKRTRGQGR